MAKSRLSGGYFGNAVDSSGESEGFGCSERIDAEISVSEGSSIPPRKCISLNSNCSRHDAFGVPMRVLTVSNLSSLQRKDLAQKLKSELEQVRLLQKKVELRGKKGVALSSSSDMLSCSNGNNKRNGSRIEDLEKPLGKKPRGWNGVFSGKFESVAVAARNCSSSTASTLLMKDCGSLLKRLMSHQFGWVFNNPVDVVKLNLPDYFSIIKQPMDLGTIKGKLAVGAYTGPLQFAEDVRLTFSNAMTYNPRGNDVHIMADTLSKYFELRWKTIEKKLPRTYNAMPLTAKPDTRENVERNRPILPSKKRKVESLPPQVEVVPPAKRVMSDKEKHKLGIELESLMAEMPVHIVDFLKEHSSNSGDCEEDEIEIDIDVLSDDTLFTLQKLLADHRQDNQKKEAKVEACEIEQLNHSGPTDSSFQAFGGNDPADEEEVDIGGDEPPVSSYPPVEIEKDKAHEMNQRLSRGSSSDTDSSSSSDSDSDDDKASPGNVSKVPENLGSAAQSHENIRDAGTLERNQSVSGLDLLEDNSHKKPSSCEFDCHQDGDNGMTLTHNRQVSPDKLYRAALLKNRFADTILKAREKTLAQGVNKDPEKLRQDREKLEMERQKEKARLQAEAKAAEDARKKAETEAAKRKREHEREVARQALLQVEKTVDIDESSKFLKDLEMLRAVPAEPLPSLRVDETSPDHSLDGLGSFKLRGSNPLEQLGLYIKDDGEEEEGDPICVPNSVNDIEDGEID